MPLKQQRLYINIDHVATLRQARRGVEPDPIEAAEVCEAAGADGITAHLREDRRHIQDRDIELLKLKVTTYLNLELAAADEIIALAVRLKPEQATLVPERRQEVTTEGGLDVFSDPERLRHAIEQLSGAGIRVSLFIDPDIRVVDQSKALGVPAIELHTGSYAHSPRDPARIEALRRAARHASEIGLAVHAGHGLSVANVAPVAAIPSVEELNIGHSIVSRAVFVGLAEAVREMRVAMDIARKGM
jgi:pyridoxine 5-phosphate synthase